MSNTYRYLPGGQVAVPSTAFCAIEVAIATEARLHRTIARNKTLPRFARLVSARALFQCVATLREMRTCEDSRVQFSYVGERS